jgi:hypothetical protein
MAAGVHFIVETVSLYCNVLKKPASSNVLTNVPYNITYSFLTIFIITRRSHTNAQCVPNLFPLLAISNLTPTFTLEPGPSNVTSVTEDSANKPI